MIRRMLGAPLGGTMVGGHHGLEVVAFPVIVPPNCGSGAGIWLPGIVVVALGEPSVPVTTCAATGTAASTMATYNAAMMVIDVFTPEVGPRGSTSGAEEVSARGACAARGAGARAGVVPGSRRPCARSSGSRSSSTTATCR